MILHDHSTAAATFLQLHLGGDRNFCYVLADPASHEAAVFDPGHDPDTLARVCGKRGLNVTRILLTHGHGDHVGGVARLVDFTDARVHAGAGERVSGALSLVDGDVLAVGALRVEALSTPGHTADHFCFLCEDILVTGDLLFCGKVGGTGSYFPGSSAEKEWESLHRLLALPDNVRVFPGHDYYGGEGAMATSTIGHERLHNPFLLCDDFAAFVHLKSHWAEYKKDHGIR